MMNDGKKQTIDRSQRMLDAFARSIDWRKAAFLRDRDGECFMRVVVDGDGIARVELLEADRVSKP